MQHAIKINEGQGPYKIIYFADPYCGYCKKFDKEVISKLKDTTVYLFLYPILSEKSINTSGGLKKLLTMEYERSVNCAFLFCQDISKLVCCPNESEYDISI